MPAKYSNTQNVSLALAVFLATDHYDVDNTPNTISTTTLLRPLRQIVLSPRIPSGEGLVSLSDMVPNRIGAAIHDGIEQAWKTNHVQALRALGYPESIIAKVLINPTTEELKIDSIPVYLEQRASKPFGKWIITGKYDFVGEGKVQDFKKTSVWAYQKQTNANKFIEQGSIYRWLNPEIIKNPNMEIHYIFLDWKAGLMRNDPSYPRLPTYTQTFQLLSLPATENLIASKIRLIEQYWDAPEEDLPLCTDIELWRSTPQFKYYKGGDVTVKRSTKNFTSQQDAALHMSTVGKGVGAIKQVPGLVTACKYCPVFSACTQKDALISSGDLDMG